MFKLQFQSALLWSSSFWTIEHLWSQLVFSNFFQHENYLDILAILKLKALRKPIFVLLKLSECKYNQVCCVLCSCVVVVVVAGDLVALQLQCCSAAVETPVCLHRGPHWAPVYFQHRRRCTALHCLQLMFFLPSGYNLLNKTQFSRHL